MLKKIVKIDDELTMILKSFILGDCVQAQYDLFRNDINVTAKDDTEKVYFAKIALREVTKSIESGELTC